MNAIEIQQVTKTYRLYNSPKDRLRELFSLGSKKYHHEFNALQDITFNVENGQTIGIIGKNGSGKSTLLKIICGVLQPTSGVVKVHGRISSLLELGAGFNPEFTGRENVYMNGALMGFTRDEMEERFAEIEGFAGIGEFIDQPVKSYSSGMYVRLAFSSAIHIDPEILIVDEALSVGDMYFQAKCMIRLKKMIDNGLTLLFVSHAMGAIKGLCHKCAYMENGQLVEYGEAPKVVDHYIRKTHLRMNQDLKTEFEDMNGNTEIEGGKSTNGQVAGSDSFRMPDVRVSTTHDGKYAEGAARYGDGGARILDVKLLNSKRQPADQIELREIFYIQFSVRFEKSFPVFAVGYSIRDLHGQKLVGTVTTFEKLQLPQARDGETYVFEIRSANKLTQGVYMVSVAVELPVVASKHHLFLDVLENAVVFNSYFPANPNDRFPAMVLVPAEFAYVRV